MKFVFSSFGFRKPIPKEKFKKIIDQESVKDKTCLIIPYAGANIQSTILYETKGLIEFGFDKDKIYFFDESIREISFIPDYIYVPGGDPFKLLNTLREYDLMKKIIFMVERGSSYIGISAGCYIATPDIAYIKALEDDNLYKSTEALGIIKCSVICHCDHYGLSQWEACKNIANTKMLMLDDNKILVFYDRENYEFID